MRKIRVRRILLWTVVFCFLLNVAFFILYISVPFSLRGKAQKGTPFFFQEEKMYCCEITDAVACGQYLYVLYDSKMVVECYDLEGNYQHSYSFDLGSKGEAQLYAADGIVYVESREHDLYSFAGAVFARFYRVGVADDAAQMKQIRLEARSQGPRIPSIANGAYEIRRASLWEIRQDGSAQVIVQRPVWLCLFQGKTLILFHAVFLIAIFILGRKRKQTHWHD